MIAGTVPKGRTRGKSGLRRAGCWVTPSGGDLKESATEMQTARREARPLRCEARMERCGKSAPAAG